MYILAMSKAGGTIGMLLWIIVLFGFMYFFMARPQKQEQKRKEAMRADLAIGDTVLTTSGFYGTVIDINDDKNCRIPAQKAAISAVEKPDDAVEESK